MTHGPSDPEAAAELESLRNRLADAEEALRAIRNGEVDGVVVAGTRGEQVYTLNGADRIYRQLIETMSEGAATLSATGVLLYCNLRVAQMLGRPLDQVVGTRLRDHLPSADQEALDEILAKARVTPCRREIHLKDSGGRSLPVQLAASCLQGEPAQATFCLVLTDLTEQMIHAELVAAERQASERAATLADELEERERAAAALRQSEERLSLALETNQTGAWDLDLVDHTAWRTPIHDRIFGYDTMLPVWTFEMFLGHVLPDDRPEVARRLDEATAAQSDWNFTCRIRRTDGEVRWIRATGVHQRDPKGNPVRMSGIVQDITERVHGEEVRAQLEVQLRLAQKMEALGTLASGVAHDFNNVLGTIIGNTELAALDLGANHAAAVSLDEIRKASRRAKALVLRILAFGSRHQEPRSVLPLRPVVEESVALLRATLPAGVEIAETFDADAPAVLADPAQIVQVLVNLCTNAWHAMEGRAGRIEIRLDSSTLDADAARADASLRPGLYARLSVTDDGKGMDAGTVERIFDPFFTTKPRGDGTGLGLTVVQGTMKGHGGAITVRSQPGSGTTFTLYFPAAIAPEASTAPEEPAVVLRPAAGGQHVLYIDDDESLVFLMTRLLGRLGYRVSGYTHPEEALAAVRKDPGQFDLVVTDLSMPGMSGLDVAREVPLLRPDLPVVLASGSITDELRAQALAAGVRQVIYKPNTVEEMCDVIQRLAGESGHRP